MLISDPDRQDVGGRGMSADIPLSQRLSYGLGAVVLHGVIGAACLIGLEGHGLELRDAVAADEIAIYVETIVPTTMEDTVREEPQPAPAPESKGEEAEAEDLSLPVEPEAEVILPSARVQTVDLSVKPTVPQKPTVQKQVQHTLLAPQGQPRAQAESKRGWVKPSYPAYLRNPPPTYPKSARKRRLEGVVYLRVWVGADGRVQNIKIATSSAHRSLDQAAVKTVRTWRFIPAKRNGKARADEVIVPVRFRLK